MSFDSDKFVFWALLSAAVVLLAWGAARCAA